jgi:predicted ester cyclase/ketosteroid isomerase-like protein
MSAEDNVAAVRDFVERAWNAGEEAVFEEHLSPDFAPMGGRDGFKAMILAFRSAFPDLEMEVHDMFGAGDKVVTRFAMHGTHKGPLFGIDATGKQVEIKGIAIDVMQGGRRVDGWAQLDRLGLLEQLGAIGARQPDRAARVEAWLRSYGDAWEARDPDAAASLFTEDASYQWGPFEAPLTGRPAIGARWSEATSGQDDVRFQSDLLGMTEDHAVAEWSCAFVRPGTGRRVSLRGIFLLRFAPDGLCRELREWWNSEERPV